MSNSKFSITDRSKILEARSVEIKFAETPIPDNFVDFTSSFKSSSSAVIKMSNFYTVDVFPNFVPILMYVQYHCVQTVALIDKRCHAKVTLPTYIMYCLTIIYGHILINDLYVRPTRSSFAQDYLSIPEKKQFTDLLLNLAVPDFLEPIIKSLTCTTTTRTGNVVFCPSAVAVTVPTHLGRFFPINMFTTIHDFVADLNPRVIPAIANACLHARTLFTIPMLHPGEGNFPCTIANLIGSFRSADANIMDEQLANRTYPSYQSTLRQSFDATFNPVLSRDYTRRQALAPTHIVPPTFAYANCNPYDILFAYSPANFNELRIVLQSVQSTFNGAITCHHDLAKLISLNAGHDILLHGYSTFALPTFHAVILHANNRATHVNAVAAAPHENRQTPTETANALHFLVLPAQPQNAFQQRFLPARPRCQVEHAHPIEYNHLAPPLNMLYDEPNAYPPNRVPAPATFIEFSEQRDTHPLLSVLEPIEDNTDIAWKAAAFGMIIESFEIDACVIPHPNPDAPHAPQNAQFANSAIPYHSAVRATTFTPAFYHYARRRTVERRNAFRAATFLIDFARLVFPRPLRNVIANFVNNGYPGFHFLNRVNWIARTAQYFGFTIESPHHIDQDDRLPPHIAPGHIHVWSPYCHVPVTPAFANPTGQFGYLASPLRGYYLTNLRSIFGTDPQLIEMNHAFACMPMP